VAVQAFLDGVITWVAISDVVDDVLQQGAGNVDDVQDVLDADRVARERATEAVHRRSAA
jgi:1-deoxy-D-xylulose 5-phosphate reductoisomerase